MKIIDLLARTVAIPLNAQLRHNTGVHPGYLMRTVLELITDEGVVGLGEVGGGPLVLREEDEGGDTQPDGNDGQDPDC